MAMNTDSSPILKSHIKDIHDSHHMLKCSTGHILPAFVEALNAVPIEVLRNVTEANFRNYSITTKWMLTRLLQVKNCPDLFLPEFLINIELLNQPLRRPLHRKNILGNPIGVETFNRIGLLLIGKVVLVST
jgi:hypothetical protein